MPCPRNPTDSSAREDSNLRWGANPWPQRLRVGQRRQAPEFRRGWGGGDEGTRTPDPRDANAVLSQLSYIPTASREYSKGTWGFPE